MANPLDVTQYLEVTDEVLSVARAGGCWSVGLALVSRSAQAQGTGAHLPLQLGRPYHLAPDATRKR